jgi:hypothetical protein
MGINAFKEKAKVFLVITGVLCFFFSLIIISPAISDEMDANHPLVFESADLEHYSGIFEQQERSIRLISSLEPTLKTDCSFSLQSSNTILNFSSPSSTPFILRC